jgi:hypothetical protein
MDEISHAQRSKDSVFVMFNCISVDNGGKMGCSCYQQCLNGKELFFAFAGDQKGKLLPESLQRLCPGLLYQLTDMTTDCIMVSVPGPEEHGMDVSTDVVNHGAGKYHTFTRVYAFPFTKTIYLQM